MSSENGTLGRVVSTQNGDMRMALSLLPLNQLRNLMPGTLYVGIDLGTTHIKVAGLRQNQHGATLQFHAVIDLVETYQIETIEDIQPDHYIEQLLKIVAAYRIEKAVLSSSLPANQALIDTIKIRADQNSEEVAETIQKQLEQVSPVPLEDMQIACHALSGEDVETDSISLLSCAVPNTILEKHRALLAKCGLVASIVDVDAFGLFNTLFYFINKKIAAPVILVHVGASYTVCLIMQPHRPPFFYVIEKGGNQVTTGIMDQIGMPFFKAEAFKKKMQQRNWSERSQFRESKLSSLYRDFAQELLGNVRKCVRHYQTQQGVAAMNKVLLTGGSATLPYLVETSEEVLSFPTTIWNPLSRFRRSRDDVSANPDAAGLQLPVVLGAVLRGD